MISYVWSSPSELAVCWSLQGSVFSLQYGPRFLGRWQEFDDALTVPFCVITDLSPADRYAVRVRAKDLRTGRWGPWLTSNVDLFTADAETGELPAKAHPLHRAQLASFRRHMAQVVDASGLPCPQRFTAAAALVAPSNEPPFPLSPSSAYWQLSGPLLPLSALAPSLPINALQSEFGRFSRRPQHSASQAVSSASVDDGDDNKPSPSLAAAILNFFSSSSNGDGNAGSGDSNDNGVSKETPPPASADVAGAEASTKEEQLRPSFPPPAPPFPFDRPLPPPSYLRRPVAAGGAASLPWNGTSCQRCSAMLLTRVQGGGSSSRRSRKSMAAAPGSKPVSNSSAHSGAGGARRRRSSSVAPTGEDGAPTTPTRSLSRSSSWASMAGQGNDDDEREEGDDNAAGKGTASADRVALALLGATPDAAVPGSGSGSGSAGSVLALGSEDIDMRPVGGLGGSGHVCEGCAAVLCQGCRAHVVFCLSAPPSSSSGTDGSESNSRSRLEIFRVCLECWLFAAARAHARNVFRYDRDSPAAAAGVSQVPPLVIANDSGNVFQLLMPEAAVALTRALFAAGAKRRALLAVATPEVSITPDASSFLHGYASSVGSQRSAFSARQTSQDSTKGGKEPVVADEAAFCCGGLLTMPAKLPRSLADDAVRTLSLRLFARTGDDCDEAASCPARCDLEVESNVAALGFSGQGWGRQRVCQALTLAARYLPPPPPPSPSTLNRLTIAAPVPRPPLPGGGTTTPHSTPSVSSSASPSLALISAGTSASIGHQRSASSSASYASALGGPLGTARSNVPSSASSLAGRFGIGSASREGKGAATDDEDDDIDSEDDDEHDDEHGSVGALIFSSSAGTGTNNPLVALLYSDGRATLPPSYLHPAARVKRALKNAASMLEFMAMLQQHKDAVRGLSIRRIPGNEAVSLYSSLLDLWQRRSMKTMKEERKETAERLAQEQVAAGYTGITAVTSHRRRHDAAAQAAELLQEAEKAQDLSSIPAIRMAKLTDCGTVLASLPTLSHVLRQARTDLQREPGIVLNEKADAMGLLRPLAGHDQDTKSGQEEEDEDVDFSLYRRFLAPPSSSSSSSALPDAAAGVEAESALHALAEGEAPWLDGNSLRSNEVPAPPTEEGMVTKPNLCSHHYARLGTEARVAQWERVLEQKLSAVVERLCLPALVVKPAFILKLLQSNQEVKSAAASLVSSAPSAVAADELLQAASETFPSALRAAVKECVISIVEAVLIICSRTNSGGDAHSFAHQIFGSCGGGRSTVVQAGSSSSSSSRAQADDDEEEEGGNGGGGGGTASSMRSMVVLRHVQPNGWKALGLDKSHTVPHAPLTIHLGKGKASPDDSFAAGAEGSSPATRLLPVVRDLALHSCDLYQLLDMRDLEGTTWAVLQTFIVHRLRMTRGFVREKVPLHQSYEGPASVALRLLEAAGPVSGNGAGEGTSNGTGLVESLLQKLSAVDPVLDRDALSSLLSGYVDLVARKLHETAVCLAGSEETADPVPVSSASSLFLSSLSVAFNMQLMGQHLPRLVEKARKLSIKPVGRPKGELRIMLRSAVEIGALADPAAEAEGGDFTHHHRHDRGNGKDEAKESSGLFSWLFKGDKEASSSSSSSSFSALAHRPSMSGEKALRSLLMEAVFRTLEARGLEPDKTAALEAITKRWQQAQSSAMASAMMMSAEQQMLAHAAVTALASSGKVIMPRHLSSATTTAASAIGAAGSGPSALAPLPSHPLLEASGLAVAVSMGLGLGGSTGLLLANALLQAPLYHSPSLAALRPDGRDTDDHDDDARTMMSRHTRFTTSQGGVMSLSSELSSYHKRYGHLSGDARSLQALMERDRAMREQRRKETEAARQRSAVGSPGSPSAPLPTAGEGVPPSLAPRGTAADNSPAGSSSSPQPQQPRPVPVLVATRPCVYAIIRSGSREVETSVHELQFHSAFLEESSSSAAAIIAPLAGSNSIAAIMLPTALRASGVPLPSLPSASLYFGSGDADGGGASVTTASVSPSESVAAMLALPLTVSVDDLPPLPVVSAACRVMMSNLPPVAHVSKWNEGIVFHWDGVSAVTLSLWFVPPGCPVRSLAARTPGSTGFQNQQQPHHHHHHHHPHHHPQPSQQQQHICLGTATISVMSLFPGVPSVVKDVPLTTRVHARMSVPVLNLPVPPASAPPPAAPASAVPLLTPPATPPAPLLEKAVPVAAVQEPTDPSVGKELGATEDQPAGEQSEDLKDDGAKEGGSDDEKDEAEGTASESVSETDEDSDVDQEEGEDEVGSLASGYQSTEAEQQEEAGSDEATSEGGRGLSLATLTPRKDGEDLVPTLGTPSTAADRSSSVAETPSTTVSASDPAVLGVTTVVPSGKPPRSASRLLVGAGVNGAPPSSPGGNLSVLSAAQRRRMRARTLFSGNSMMTMSLAGPGQLPTAAPGLPVPTAGQQQPMNQLPHQQQQQPLSASSIRTSSFNGGNGGGAPKQPPSSSATTMRKRPRKMKAVATAVAAVVVAPPAAAAAPEQSAKVEAQRDSDRPRAESAFPTSTPTPATAVAKAAPPPAATPAAASLTLSGAGMTSGGGAGVVEVDDYVDVTVGKLSLELFFWPKATVVIEPEGYLKKKQRREAKRLAKLAKLKEEEEQEQEQEEAGNGEKGDVAAEEDGAVAESEDTKSKKGNATREGDASLEVNTETAAVAIANAPAAEGEKGE